MIRYLIPVAAACHPVEAVALALVVAVAFADFAAVAAGSVVVDAAGRAAAPLLAYAFADWCFAVAVAAVGFAEAFVHPVAGLLLAHVRHFAGVGAVVPFPCFYGWFFPGL